VAVRSILICVAVLMLAACTAKIVLMFRNVDRRLWTLPKSIIYCYWALWMATLVSELVFEAGVKGDALHQLMQAMFIVMELSFFAIVLYTTWFCLFCLSLLVRMTLRRTRIAKLCVGGVVVLLMLLLLALTIAAFVLANRAQQQSGEDISELLDTLSAIQLAFVATNIVVLAYIISTFLVFPLLIWHRFHRRPPALIRALAWLLAGHVIVGLIALGRGILVLITFAWLLNGDPSDDALPGLSRSAESIASYTLQQLLSIGSAAVILLTISHRKTPYEPRRHDTSQVSTEASPLLNPSSIHHHEEEEEEEEQDMEFNVDQVEEGD
jgi:hypothetical protein